MTFRQVNDEVLAAAIMNPNHRGLVLELTSDEVVNRLRYLAGKVGSKALDPWVHDPTPECATGYYRLNGEHDDLPPYNGGKNPTARDPFDRWSKPKSTFVNVTSDCIGGMAWANGFDRYQPERFKHIYGGWINTDSMRQDARRVVVAGSPRRCFERISRPEPGAMIVFASKTGGHDVGHIGGIVAYNGLEWDPRERDCWRLIDVVDVAGRKGRANLQTNGLGWYFKGLSVDAGAWFIRSIMPASV